MKAVAWDGQMVTRVNNVNPAQIGTLVRYSTPI
jgi:hypothetical protein